MKFFCFSSDSCPSQEFLLFCRVFGFWDKERQLPLLSRELLFIKTIHTSIYCCLKDGTDEEGYVLVSLNRYIYIQIRNLLGYARG